MFRIDAVREHEVDCPSCSGTMRLAFHAGVERSPTSKSRLAAQFVRPLRAEIGSDSALGGAHGAGPVFGERHHF